MFGRRGGGLFVGAGGLGGWWALELGERTMRRRLKWMGVKGGRRGRRGRRDGTICPKTGTGVGNGALELGGV